MTEEITLRDYFIAHAPAKPQVWFEPVMRKHPKFGPFVSNDGNRKYKTQREARIKEGDNFYNENEAELEIWKLDYEEQKLIQWPAAWADAMMIARQYIYEGVPERD